MSKDDQKSYINLYCEWSSFTNQAKKNKQFKEKALALEGELKEIDQEYDSDRILPLRKYSQRILQN
jgi:hypothetical protein